MGSRRSIIGAWLPWSAASELLAEARSGFELLAEVELPTPVVPAERARRGKGGVWYTPRRYLQWRQAASWCMRAALQAKGMTGHEPREATYAVDIVLPLGSIRANTDVDNVAKAVLDAGTSILWPDDRYVASLRVVKCMPPPYKPLARAYLAPRVQLEIQPSASNNSTDPDGRLAVTCEPHRATRWSRTWNET